ncbi:MAG: transposase [Verrucomicrobiales bacterium]|nr:transposase [Verrucomicrobiales bacterium]
MSVEENAGKRFQGLPRNPGLRRFIEGKRQTANLLPTISRGFAFAGWHERGYLPHRDESGLTQFVTFHLADAYPAELRAEWSSLLAGEKDPDRRRWLEGCLDRGRGSCWLGDDRVARIVEQALRFHHGQRYELLAWVIMPNHVHALVRTGDVPLGRIIGNWKRFTSREASRILMDRGQGGIWAPDYWDTYMRDSQHEQRVLRYIENNPAKARLVLDPRQWAWSSARYRGEDGQLRLPNL